MKSMQCCYFMMTASSNRGSCLIIFEVDGFLLPYSFLILFIFTSIKMKSYIWLQTTDGSIQQVEEEVAMFCPMICREVLQTGMGSSKNYAISLPQRVNPAILGLILDYCQFHQVPGHSNKVCCDLCWFLSFKN